jgi:hypothetical protein
VRKICIPPIRSSGRNTMATTMIPTPPNHCSIPRHSNSPRGSPSRPEKTVAPVVVSPDMASKNASVTSASVAPKMKGSAPNTGSASHTPEVSRKVCCRDSRARGALAQASASAAPIITVSSIDRRKTCHSPLPSAISMASGKLIIAPRARTSQPTT